MFKLSVVFLIIYALLVPGLCFAQEPVKTEPKPETQPVLAPTAKPSAPKPLGDDENPLLIGKRNINKRQLDFYSLDKEVALGRQLDAELTSRGAKYVDDPVITEYVNRVGQNIVLHSDAKIPFTIKVLNVDDVNAFALPGGFLYVNKGLLLTAETEAELAGVMAHEIAHVTARHGVENASKGKLLQYALTPLQIFGGGLGPLVQILIGQGLNFGLPMAFMKFSRDAEAEADKLGAQYLWASGYDPTNLVSFFEKLDQKNKKKPGVMSKLFGSHPPTADRIEKVSALLTRFPDRDEYTITTSEFIRVKKRLLAISAPKRIDAEGNRDTGPKRPTLKRRNEGDPSDPSAQPKPTEEKKDKPTLKRRDSDGKPPDAEKPPQS